MTTKTKKNPQTNDRFRITVAIDVDSEHVGSILATFTKAGYTNLHCELITDELAYKHNSRKKPKVKTTRGYDVPNSDLVIRLAKKLPGGRFTIQQVKKLMSNNSRPSSSAHPVCSDLVSRGLIHRLSAGKFKLTTKAKGLLAKAANKPKAVKPRSNGAAATEEAHG